MRTKKTVLFILLFAAIVVAAWFILPASRKKAQGLQKQEMVVRPGQPALTIGYDSTKKRVLLLKKKLAGTISKKPPYSGADMAKFATAFTDLINLQLTPYWLGTPWDFNGTTQQPGRGQIACGYFITTLLRDAGVPLNRVKLAQCASGIIINTLVEPEHQKNYSRMSFAAFIHELKSRGTGVYIVGLDFHTGFLLNDGKELYFIHSNYIQRKGVVKEVASESAALQASKWRSTGCLTRSTGFLQRWMNNQVQ